MARVGTRVGSQVSGQVLDDVDRIVGLDRLAEVYMDGPEKSSRDKHQQRDKLASQRTATMARMQYYQLEYDRLMSISHELRDLCAHATSQLTYQIDR